MTDDPDREAFEAWKDRGDDLFGPLDVWRAALAHERAKTSWQPIDTAPKNGDPILIACNSTKSMRWAVWSDGFWRDGQASVGGRIAGVPNPTHWRPLPELPK